MYNKTTKGDILYIRHGETDYNKYLNVSTNPKEIQISEDFIDCSLNEEGIIQSNILASTLNELNIKYVFCSPLSRCLETAFNALKNHPMKENFTVYVHPLLTEIINGAQDIPTNINKKRKIFSDISEVKFDWSIFDSYYSIENSDLFFLDFIDNIDDSFDLANILNELRENPIKSGLISKLLAYYIFKGKRPETHAHLLNRSNTFKNYLIEFLKQKDFCPVTILSSENEDIIEEGELKTNQEKVLVITHSAFIRMSTTQVSCGNKERLDYYPEDCYKPKNCEAITINLQY